MMILKLTAITETMRDFERELNAISIASNLTGTVVGIVKYRDELPPRYKKWLLEHLMDLHDQYPMAMSDKIKEECKKLINGLPLE